jgi:nitroreductase
MKLRFTAAAAFVLLFISMRGISQELKPILLPAPAMEGGMPLMQALRERKTTRKFTSEKLPPQTVSDLLWAANGVNRPSERKRTAPSAMNRQEIAIYAAMEDGLFLYDAFANRLIPVLAEDIRGATGSQDFVRIVPVNLIYVATVSTDSTVAEKDRIFYPAVDTGFISQNVYLYCASAGLGTVVRGMVDRAMLEKKMGLRPDQRVILSQSVGVPEK